MTYTATLIQSISRTCMSSKCGHVCWLLLYGPTLSLNTDHTHSLLPHIHVHTEYDCDVAASGGLAPVDARSVAVLTSIPSNHDQTTGEIQRFVQRHVQRYVHVYIYVQYLYLYIVFSHLTDGPCSWDFLCILYMCSMTFTDGPSPVHLHVQVYMHVHVPWLYISHHKATRHTCILSSICLVCSAHLIFMYTLSLCWVWVTVQCLSLFRSELTGTSEGGKTGPAGGGDYVVSSKWARDRDINLKIRSIYHVYTVYMHTYVCMYSRMYMYMYINVESLQC